MPGLRAKHSVEKIRIYNVIFILQLFCCGTAAAQFFGFLQTNPQSHYFAALGYPQDGNYRTLSCREWSMQEPGFYQRSQVRVYNSSFQLTDTINLLNGVIPIGSEPLKKSNRLYWAGRSYDTINADPFIQQLVVLELDTNYHHVALHKINNLSNSFLITTNIVPIGNRFFVYQWNLASGTSIIYKMSEQFVKIDSAVYNAAIHEMWGVGDQLMLSVSDFPSPCYDPTSGKLEKLMIDTVFNRISCYTFNLGPVTYSFNTTDIQMFAVHAILKPISRTKTFAGGYFDVSPVPLMPKMAMINGVFDNNDMVINKSLTADLQTSIVYGDAFNLLATKPNELITVGCYGYEYLAGTGGQPANNKIFINKFDSLGNVIWQKKIGDNFFYNPTGIVFTTDGGCLVSGWRYPAPRATNPVLPVESFLLKLDINGDFGFTALSDVDPIGQEIRCFPNPSTGQLFFDVPLYDTIEITIYSLLGAEVSKVNNYKALSAINVSHFQNGMYFYRLYTKNRNYSGKFLKE